MNRIYVDTNGDDQNAGTEQAPVLTLDRAQELVEPGGTVYIAPGTYQDRVLTRKNGLGPHHPTVWKGTVARDRPIIVPAASDTTRPLFVTHQHHSFEDIVFDGRHTQLECAKITHQANSFASNITLNNCTLRNSRSFACLMTGFDRGVRDIKLLDCELLDCGIKAGRGDHALYISVDGVVVENCLIRNCSGWGIHNYRSESDPGTGPSHNRYRNNVIMGCGWGDTKQLAVAIGIYGGTDIEVSGNILRGNLRDIVAVDYGAQNVTIR